MTESVTVAGRTVTYAEWGDRAGLPILVMHGTPGSRLGRFSDAAALAATGARLIRHDRPGYGGSDRFPGRRVADVVADAIAVLDALGVDRFAVSGDSGGGPHALAVAAALPGRVLRVRVTASLAPYGIAGFFDGMDSENIAEWHVVVRGEAALAPEITRRAKLKVERVRTSPEQIFAGFRLPDADRAALADTRGHAVLRESVLEALKQGPWGWVDDDLAFATDWGFDVSTISVPAEVRYGRHDVLVPPSHGAWLAAHIPECTVEVWDRRGHLSDPDGILADIRSLVVAARS